jgi:predicted alpha/beta-hydrolase family hydrolase
MAEATDPISIEVNDTIRVSGLLQAPPGARACYVLAHGAGAGMHHPFMADVARGLALRGLATLRYQFPYMERAAGDRIRRNWPMQRSTQPWPRSCACCRTSRWLSAVNRSAAA